MEIFIIGGGISGLFCGINLAESGIDVKIIEKKEEIGKPLKCAEGVSENGIEILGDREIIESVKKKEIKGSVMILPNGKKIYFIKKGFLIDREKLEKLLEMKFLKNGGKIIRDKVERIEGNKIFGLKKIYKGDLIVIASGTNFIKGIEYPYKGFLFATEKRIKSNEENEFLKFYYGEIYKPIYMWKFYHGDYFGIGKAYRDKKEFEIIKNFLNERDVFKTITGKLPFPLNPPKFLYKDKKFFIGDAGAFVNQLTFAGIHGALLSAILCAERIKEFLKNKNYNELEKFNENLKILPIFSKSIYKARNILYSSSNSELNLIGELMDRRKYDEIPYIKAIKNLIKNPLFTKTYLKFLYIEKIFKKCENFSF